MAVKTDQCSIGRISGIHAVQAVCYKPSTVRKQATSTRATKHKLQVSDTQGVYGLRNQANRNEESLPPLTSYVPTSEMASWTSISLDMAESGGAYRYSLYLLKVH